MDPNRKPKLPPPVQEVVDAMVPPEAYQVDPEGSWTGRPRNRGEKPLQDQDDL